MADRNLARLLETFVKQIPDKKEGPESLLQRAMHAAYGTGFAAARNQVPGANPAQPLTWPLSDEKFVAWNCVIPSRHYLGLRIWQTANGSDISAADTIVGLGNTDISNTANANKANWHEPDGLFVGFWIGAPAAMRAVFTASSNAEKTHIQISLAGSNLAPFGPLLTFTLAKSTSRTIDLYFDRA